MFFLAYTKKMWCSGELQKDHEKLRREEKKELLVRTHKHFYEGTKDKRIFSKLVFPEKTEKKPLKKGRANQNKIKGAHFFFSVGIKLALPAVELLVLGLPDLCG